MHGVSEEQQTSGLGRSGQGGEKWGCHQRVDVGRGEGADSQGNGEPLELVNIGVVQPDRYLETVPPVAVWSDGGDRIGISHSLRVWSREGASGESAHQHLHYEAQSQRSLERGR